VYGLHSSPSTAIFTEPLEFINGFISLIITLTQFSSLNSLYVLIYEDDIIVTTFHPHIRAKFYQQIEFCIWSLTAVGVFTCS
jgi:GR25 family glycosyltransferase involved in LPS biosynthesis